MTRVEVEIGEDAVTVRVPERHWSGSWRDTLTVGEGSRILAIGEPVDAPAPDGAERRAVLNAPNFDPELANAMIRALVYNGLRESGLGWRAWISTVELRLWFPRWRHIPPVDRLRVLEDPPARSVSVNGEVVIRPWLPLPLVDRLLGTRWVAPDPR
jgi:hypothetical protein